MNWTSLGAQLAQIGLPAIGTLLGGPLGGTIGGVVGRGIAAALGTPDATPTEISQMVASNPDAVRERLAQIEADTKAREADVRELEIAAEDRGSARQMQIAVAHEDGPAKYMPTVVTGLNYLFAAAIFAGVASGAFREDGIIVGFSLGAVTSAVTFWLGSSAGSKRSADAVRNIAVQAATASPPPVARRGR